MTPTAPRGRIERRAGAGVIRELPALLRARGVRSCLLVTGGKSYVDSGAASVEQLLNGIEVTRVAGIRPDPDLADLTPGVARLRAAGVDAVIGIGGGSVLDYAKAITALAPQDHSPEESYTNGVRALVNERTHLLVLVPTTAGTGSEVTSIAVLTVQGRKRSLHHPRLLADIAVIDPALTLSVPPWITASTGADALSQAIESYWSISSTDRSRRYALESMTLAAGHLQRATGDGDLPARIAMSQAATLSGLAIDITQTTVPHALSYLLTTRFGVPHGHACGVFLRPVLDYNAGVGPADVADPRGVRFVLARIREITSCLRAAGAGDHPGAIDDLLRGAGLSMELTGFGVAVADVDALVDAAMDSPRMTANPRYVPREALRELVLARL
ncbi:MAG: phosphonoacetaldehyde reductase [Pseudonocardiaceae bacterium]